MDENETLSSAFDKLGEMLSTEDGQKQISDILSMFSGANSENNPEKEQQSAEKGSDEKSSFQSSGFSSADFDMLSKAKKLLGASGISGKKDKNAAFLEALKPFLKKERRQKLDGAIKLIGVASLFKEFGGFSKGGD